MHNFTFYNPTKLMFGKDSVQRLPKEVRKYGKNVLVVYGGGSIKANGVYDAVMKQLDGCNVVELAGVEPNPRVQTARQGAALCREHSIDVVLAVGGGSVIDCAKLIVAAAKTDADAWDIVLGNARVTDALPLGTVLTLAATGSEMNCNSVITNSDTQQKLGWSSLLVFPAFSILDPAYTLTVPKDQTIYGIVDIMSHVFEQYFHDATNTKVTDSMCEGVLRTVVETAPLLVNDLQNVEYRETILLAGTVALNNILGMGSDGDWGTHEIEHAVSAVYDIPHGGGLAILFPNWMHHNMLINPKRFAQLGVRVFGVDPTNKTVEQVATESIESLRAFWTSIGAPIRLADYSIDAEKIPDMVQHALIHGPFGRFARLDSEDVYEILEKSL